jgi:hypothetical protein
MLDKRGLAEYDDKEKVGDGQQGSWENRRRSSARVTVSVHWWLEVLH